MLYFLSDSTFHVPTEASEMTPERFHDFLSLASSPPLRLSFPSHHLSSTPLSQHSLTKRETETRFNGGDGESIDQQSVENVSIQSAPSFAQVSQYLYSSTPPLSPPLSFSLCMHVCLCMHVLIAIMKAL